MNTTKSFQWPDKDEAKTQGFDRSQIIGTATGLRFHLSKILYLESTNRTVWDFDPETDLSRSFKTGLALVRDRYEIANQATVLRFLMKKLSLIDSLNKAFLEIKNHFGTSVSVSLVLAYDPDGTKSILGIIRVPGMNIEDLYETFIKFEEEWLIKHYATFDNQLNFIIDTDEL